MDDQASALHQPERGSPDDLVVRPARETDVRDIAELWSEAFPGERTIVDRIRMLEQGGRYGGLETVLAGRDGGDRLVGACKIYRMAQNLAGAAMPMMALAAVAVTPSRRREGIGSRLCTEAIGMAADRGDVVSVLYPFRPDYYERLGWGLVGELHEYRFRTGALTGYDDARHVRQAREEDAGPLWASYRRVAERSNGPVTRDRPAWAYRLADEELGVRPVDPPSLPATPDGEEPRVVVYDRDGISGYALFRYRATRAPRDRTLVVRELVAESETAYRGLLGHIAQLSSRWPLARHRARPEERFGDRLGDPRPPRGRLDGSLYFPTARIVRGPMLRVIDVPGALRMRRWWLGARHPGTPLVIRIEVGDHQRPGNRGPWRVAVSADGCSADVDPWTEPAAPDGVSAALTTDAATFARIFAGEVPATAAAILGRATISGAVDTLDAAFAAHERFWLLDEF